MPDPHSCHQGCGDRNSLRAKPFPPALSFGKVKVDSQKHHRRRLLEGSLCKPPNLTIGGVALAERGADGYFGTDHVKSREGETTFAS